MGFGKRLSFVVGLLLAITSVALCWRQIKVRDKITYACLGHRFTEPIEVMYLITSDMTLYKVTSNDELSISFYMEDLKRMLKKNGHSISDIIVIIHNHLPMTTRRFTPDDVDAWRQFKREGFTGNFYLYIEGNKTIYELLENEDDDSK